jgi:hypothetical protein
MALTQEQVSMLYVAIFNRASEGEGNKYWQNDQPDMVTTANVMLATPDAQEYFGDTLNDNQAFIEWIYKNTLNKTADEDPEGIAYWVNELNNGKTKGEVVTALINAIEQYKDSDDPKTKEAYDQFMNRVEVSNYTAEHVEKAPENYKEVLGFNGELVVTADPDTVTQAEAKVDELASSMGSVAGEEFLLTDGPDIITGTSGDDIIKGLVVKNETNGWNVDTFTDEDRVDGGAGNDTLIIQQTEGSTNKSVSGMVSNVENIEFTAFGSVTYDMSNTTGVENFVNQYSVDDLTLKGAKEMDLGLKSINGKSTTVNFDGTVYATTNDSINLTLENVTNEAKISLNSDTNDIETLNIEAKSAASKVDLGGTAIDGTTKLVITGDKDLSIDDTDGSQAMTKITTVDASAFTGNLDLDLRNGGDNKLNITTGSGDDSVIVTNFTKDDTIDLGEGKDLLAIDLTQDVAVAPSLKNIEQIAFRTSGGDNTVNLDGATELEEIYMENAQNGGADTLTLIKVGEGVKSVNFVNHDNTKATSFDNLALVFGNDEAVDTLDINFGSVKSSSNPVPVNMDDNQILTLGEIQLNGVENININTQNLSKDNDGDTDPSDAGLKIDEFTAENLVNLTISSDSYVNIGNSLSDTVKSVDASAATAGIHLNLESVKDSTSASNNAYTVTTGSGSDTLENVNVSDSSVTIKTDAGNDSITTTGGKLAEKAKVLIDAGDGNDTINISSITDTNGGSIKITTGDGIDTIYIDEEIANGDAKNNVVITDFQVGVGGDNISISGSSNKDSFDYSNDVNKDAGAEHLDVAKDDDGKYDIFTNGADAFIYDDNGDLIVTLSGISSLDNFNADNFAV